MSKKAKDLDEILQIYEDELCNHIYRYRLDNKTDVEIVFYIENFCHLLGLQHIYGRDKRYLGINGYNKIKTGEGQFIRFYQYRTKPLTTIAADFVIYQDKKEYILHLFLRQERKGSDQYSPISFVVKSDNDKNKEQYLV